MPKEFEPGARYQGYAQSQGFDPIKPVDVTPLLRENRQVEQNNMQRMLNQSLQVMQIEADAERRVIDQQNRVADLVASQELEDLATFSQTLTNSITAYRDYRKEKDIEAGMALAYTDGLPESAMEQFRQQELMAEEAAMVAKGIGAQLEAEDAPTDVVQKARKLSGWKGYGYARGIAQLAGQQYGAFYEEAATRVQIDLNGRAVSLENAQNSSERAAVEAEIRRQYLKNFEGMNLALLNEYLFPAMKQYEVKAATEFAIEQRGRLQAERKTEMLDSFSGYAANNQMGVGFEKLLSLYQYDFGGKGKARDALLKHVKEGLDSGLYSPEQVEALLDHKIIMNGKEVTIRKQFRVQLAAIDMGKSIYEAGLRPIARAQEEKKAKETAFIQDLQEKEASRGVPLSEGELQVLKQYAYGKDGLGLGYIPNYLKDYETRNEQDQAASQDYADLLKARQGGVIYTEQARGLHPSVRIAEAANIRDSELVRPNEVLEKDADDDINRLASQELKAGGELTGNLLEKTFIENAKSDYLQRYQTYMLSDQYRPQEAHDKALAEVIEKAKDNTSYRTREAPPSGDKDLDKTITEAEKALQSGGFNVPIAALAPAVEQLAEYQEQGKTDIPYEFHAVARAIRGVDGWDLAAIQYNAHGKGTLQKPGVEQRIDGYTPLVRSLLREYNTPSRTFRAQLEAERSGQDIEPFLDLVKAKESKAYGEYDAMNTGGSHGGHKAYGSANSKDVFGRGLSEMTIAEVMDLQAQQKVFAAGAFQIIPNTMKMVVQLAGIPLDAKFDKATQDRLAIALYLNRVRLHGTNAEALMSGLRSEWIGLQNVPDIQLQEAIEPLSVYNQPQYILPALAGGSQ